VICCGDWLVLGFLNLIPPFFKGNSYYYKLIVIPTISKGEDTIDIVSVYGNGFK
jgi:hypothetical protein